MTNRILILFLLFTTTITYSKSYFLSDVFFNKYQEIYEIPQTGFYIEYEKIDDTEKISLFKDLKLIKYKTKEIIEDRQKITHYNEKEIKTKEEIYDNLHNKIQEIRYSTKGILLESVNYFYKNNDLICKEIKILDQKPKTLHYMRNTDGKLLKITGSNFQVWNYGLNGDIKSTYFDINKSKTKAIRYDENKKHLESIITDNNKIKSREKNKYLEDETINTLEEDDMKTISKYKGSNLIKKEIYKNNEIINVSDFEYNESGLITVENVTVKEKKKEYTTKTEYEYDSDNKLKLKRIYENDLISLKIEYFSDNEYEQEIYYDGEAIFKVRYKDDKVIEEINQDITRDSNGTK
ncbi:hypothetical protein DB313_00395 [Borrelia turcica IST7]|uniref:Uncharacterized protein n=1 Tax=Borrelia turcica IST7 TaxID=1104446 RepID=A0A386PM09_9SPIR|nr:hypothetical protein [Borrelia turcica]AYE35973.1 hypothetical protein DB313_00395 [Borrelia turcica IST7]